MVLFLMDNSTELFKVHLNVFINASLHSSLKTADRVHMSLSILIDLSFFLPWTQTPTSLIEAVRRTLRTMQQGKDPDSIASKLNTTNYSHIRPQPEITLRTLRVLEMTTWWHYCSRARPNTKYMLQSKTDAVFSVVGCSVHLLPAGDATGVWGPERGYHLGEPQTAPLWHFFRQKHACEGEEEAAQRVWKASPRGLPPASLLHLLKHATEGCCFCFLDALHKASMQRYSAYTGVG